MAANVGLVCLLPHGYEGQGPEHSSARLERFLQMCAEDNMQVANVTTPANYFHILRRQLKRDFRKPLILMTPKSLLRHPRCKSTLAEMAEGSVFHRWLHDDAGSAFPAVRSSSRRTPRSAASSCARARSTTTCWRTARSGASTTFYIMRVEQLYPFPLKSLAQELSRFKNAELVWCQEEPQNMGSWSYIGPYLEWVAAQPGSRRSGPLRRASGCGRHRHGLMSRHQRS